MVTRGWNTLPSAAMRAGKTSATQGTGEKTRQGHTDGGKESSATENTEVRENGEKTNKTGGMVMLFGCGDPPSVLRERLEAVGGILKQVRMVMRNYDRDLPDLNEPLEGKKIKAPTRAEKDYDTRLDLHFDL